MNIYLSANTEGITREGSRALFQQWTTIVEALGHLAFYPPEIMSELPPDEKDDPSRAFVLADRLKMLATCDAMIYLGPISTKTDGFPGMERRFCHETGIVDFESGSLFLEDLRKGEFSKLRSMTRPEEPDRPLEERSPVMRARPGEMRPVLEIDPNDSTFGDKRDG